MLDEDVARLLAYIRKHFNVVGRYLFRLPDLDGAWGEPRDPDHCDLDD